MRYLQIIAIYCFLATPIAILGQTALTLGSDVWPPFTDQAGEKAIALDIVKEALSRDSQGVQYAIKTFEEVMGQIESASLDGSAALWYTEERAGFLIYSEPYLQNQLILVARKGTDVAFESLGQVAGKRIGAVENYAYTDPSNPANEVQLQYATSDQENLERLISGKLDYILVDAVLIQYLLKYQMNDVTRLLEIGERPLITKNLYFALRKDVPNSAEIISLFNSQIQEMKADGTYNRILGLSWIRTDVDGDGVFELVLEGPAAGAEAPTQVYDILGQSQKPESERYFIDGQIYNTWSEVPNNYKQEIASETHPDLNHIGFKIKLNK